MWRTSAASLVLRGLTLVSKFILLMFIARFLSPEELGVWGLMNVTIGISLYLLGLDFYIFNTREILAQDETQCTPLIRDQLVFHGLVYAMVLPLLLVVFLQGLIAWQYLGWFYGLAVLEHISQESARLLITLSRPTMANLVMFLRSGAWVYAAVATAFFLEDLRGLPVIWCGWIVGVLFSIGLTAYTLRHMRWEVSKQVSINWVWMRKGVKVSLPFCCSTLSFVGIQYADRYFIQYYWGEAIVGVYTFFASIANVVHIFVFTGLIMILYPRLISSYQRGRLDDYRDLMKKMSLGIIAGIVVLMSLAMVLIEPVLQLVNRQIYVDHLSVFIIMLVTASLLTLSYIPHYSLFVRSRDTVIVFSTVAALVVALIANSLLVPVYHVQGAAYATLLSIGTMVLIKSWGALRR